MREKTELERKEQLEEEQNLKRLFDSIKPKKENKKMKTKEELETRLNELWGLKRTFAGKRNMMGYELMCLGEINAISWALGLEK